MAAFDPDKFLSQREKSNESGEQVSTGQGFNPDEFLRRAGGGSAEQPAAPFNPDVFLAAPLPTPESAPLNPIYEPGIPAPVFYYPGSAGLGQMGRDVAGAVNAARGPVTAAAMGAAERYMSAKGTKPLLDVIAMSAMPAVGLPPVPPMATIEGVRGAIQGTSALMAGAKEINDYLQRFPADAAERLRPSVTTFTEALNEEEYKKFKDAADKSGIEKAIKNYKLPERLAKNTAVVDALKTMKSITPPSTIAQVAGPLARGALKVAGPVALAYDVAQAYPYYEQANAGQRMASGEVGRQVSQARRAMLSQPTPAPLTPQEAANLLASGDRRLIDIYGGVNKLVETAGQTVAQPETPGFIDRAMNTWRRYQGVPTR